MIPEFVSEPPKISRVFETVGPESSVDREINQMGRDKKEWLDKEDSFSIIKFT